MKGIYKYMAFALALVMGACSQDDAPNLPAQELTIATRSTVGDADNNAFTHDFTLELWDTTDETRHEKHDMIYSDRWNKVVTDILPARAFAYKGTGVTVTSPTEYTLQLQADQSSAENLEDADVMIATGEATQDNPLNLNFEHCFAKVSFNCTIAPEFADVSSLIFESCQVHTNPQVKAYINGTEISAILVPDTYAAGENFLTINLRYNNTIKESLSVVAPANGLTFEAGKHYKFSLKIGKDKVTIEKAVVDGVNPFDGGWDEESKLE